MTQPRISIQEIQAGASVREVFLIASASFLQSRNGPYWRLELKDATGTLEAKIWHPQSAAYPDLLAGQFVEVMGKAGSYKEQVQLVVEKLRILPPEDVQALDRGAFMRISDPAPEIIMEQIEALCRKELTYTPWRAFALSVLKNASIRERLLHAPGAKNIHHAYAGGLLEHLLSVAGLCLKLADHYPTIDRQALFVGALFHDIGKMEEYTGGIHIDQTDEGRLMGHSTLGLLIVEPFLTKSRLENSLKTHLRHLIISHHGELAYGAAREPATPEAFLLHFADNMDAKVAQCQALFEVSAATPPKNAPAGQGAGGMGENGANATPGETFGEVSSETFGEHTAGNSGETPKSSTQLEEFLWTPWQKLFNRSLAKAPHTPEEVKKKPARRQNTKAEEKTSPQEPHATKPAQISLL